MKKDESGQSTVEYILLLAVVASLFFTVSRSQSFQDFFGSNSSFFQTLAERIAMDYRYSTFVDTGDAIPSVPPNNHPSFSQPDGSTSRFFGYDQTSVYPPN